MNLGVIIPAKNEEMGLGKTITSILVANIRPADIYVIDDGSSDRTGMIASSLGVNVLRNDVNQFLLHHLRQDRSPRRCFDRVTHRETECEQEQNPGGDRSGDGGYGENRGNNEHPYFRAKYQPTAVQDISD